MMADYNVYVKVTVEKLISGYVDDTLILCRSEKLIAQVKHDISRHFEISDLGEVKCYLGLQRN